MILLDAQTSSFYSVVTPKFNNPTANGSFIRHSCPKFTINVFFVGFCAKFPSLIWWRIITHICMFKMVHFRTTLRNNTLSPDRLGTAACLMDVYILCDFRRVTSVVPVLFCLGCLSNHQVSKHNFVRTKPYIWQTSSYFCSDYRSILEVWQNVIFQFLLNFGRV